MKTNPRVKQRRTVRKRGREKKIILQRKKQNKECRLTYSKNPTKKKK